MAGRIGTRTTALIVRAAVIASSFAGGISCGPSEDDSSETTQCLPQLPDDCSLTFPAEFESIFENRLAPTCGAGGGSCHSSEGARGGLVLDDIDRAYDHLVNAQGNETPRVIPGDPECSLLMQRLESTDTEFVMPIGGALDEGERCAIQKWIAAGAER